MSTKAREFDIVLFGATGFVGRLTARHLAAHAGPQVRVALAGRSITRLHEVAGELGAPAQAWPLLVVDADDTEAVADLARRARVVATTVGPYAKYGGPLVAACAEAGTHYCDLTGEVLFVHRSIAANSDAARRTGARIVHACGFDSVPSDLGTLLTAQAAQADGAQLTRAHLAVRSLRGGFSGGTVDSARTQADEMRTDSAARRVVADPWALAEGGRPPTAGGTASRRRHGGLRGRLASVTAAVPVRRDVDNGHFTGPFVMAAFNSRIVARSASLLGYGAGFRYVEYTDYGAGVRGAVTAAGSSLVLGVGLAGLAIPLTRPLLDRVLPDPGEGPSTETQERGRLRADVTADATNGARYRTTMTVPYDPGYLGTAYMFGEAALALAEDGAPLPDAAGVLTPATALGNALVERLRRHGFTFETQQLPG